MDERTPDTADARGESPRGGEATARDDASRDAAGRDAARSGRDDAELPQRDAGSRDHPGRASVREGSGPTITGRSFAGASYGSNQREQTADHRGESQKHKLDDGGSRTDEHERRPADES